MSRSIRDRPNKREPIQRVTVDSSTDHGSYHHVIGEEGTITWLHNLGLVVMRLTFWLIVSTLAFFAGMMTQDAIIMKRKKSYNTEGIDYYNHDDPDHRHNRP